LGRVEIPRTQDCIDKGTEEGKCMKAIIDLKAFTELIHSVDATRMLERLPLGLSRVAKPRSMTMEMLLWNGKS
jgi:hypothetical protein